MFEKLLAWIAGPPQGQEWPAFFDRRNCGPSVDLAKLGAELVTALPRCSAKVLVAGPSYEENKYFKGDVIADTAAFLPWAVERAGSGSLSSNKEYQAAIEILPAWLGSADLANASPTLVTPPFQAVLRDYAHILAAKHIAQVHCTECGHLVSAAIKQDLNSRNSWAFQWATKDWHCPSGHLLFQVDWDQIDDTAMICTRSPH